MSQKVDSNVQTENTAKIKITKLKYKFLPNTTKIYTLKGSKVYI